MDGKRPLEIGEHVVHVGFLPVVRDYHVAFHGGLRIARVVDGNFDHLVGFGKGLVGIAVAEVAVRHDIGAAGGMHQGRAVLGRFPGVDYRRQRLVGDLDVIERILGQVPVFGDYHCHRLADEAHAVDGERPLVHGLAQDDQERVRILLDLLAGKHRHYARLRDRCRGIDGNDFRLGMGRAQDRCVQHPWTRR